MPEGERFETAVEVERLDLSGDRGPEEALREAQQECLERALARITRRLDEESFQMDDVHVSSPFELEGDWYVTANVVVWVEGPEGRGWPRIP